MICMVKTSDLRGCERNGHLCHCGQKSEKEKQVHVTG